MKKKAFLCTECTDLVLSFVYGNVRIKKYHVRNLYGIYIETLWPPCNLDGFMDDFMDEFMNKMNAISHYKYPGSHH